MPAVAGGSRRIFPVPPHSLIFIDSCRSSFVVSYNMSFDRLNSLEAQSGFSRSEDAQYRDDPGFDQLAESLSDQLFTLNSNTARLTHQINLLGTKRDTERVRERVHNMLEETRNGFKDVGEGFKQIQTWEDVNVCFERTDTYQGKV